jgi:hypothetical protein
MGGALTAWRKLRFADSRVLKISPHRLGAIVTEM